MSYSQRMSTTVDLDMMDSRAYGALPRGRERVWWAREVPSEPYYTVITH